MNEPLTEKQIWSLIRAVSWSLTIYYIAAYRQVSAAAIVEQGINPKKLRRWLETARDWEKVFEKACPTVLTEMIVDIQHKVVMGYKLRKIAKATEQYVEEGLIAVMS